MVTCRQPHMYCIYVCVCVCIVPYWPTFSTSKVNDSKWTRRLGETQKDPHHLDPAVNVLISEDSFTWEQPRLGRPPRTPPPCAQPPRSGLLRRPGLPQRRAGCRLQAPQSKALVPLSVGSRSSEKGK
ncbi:hypothetical protein H1C71_014951 [Ictidomys tridecemlineatus]|nr:hypothetical protein H1C71_014951 [Ictidomys tridecemlineatus]KAG3293381.1 hypothetical protein H1C71_014951 [Ictidomys tridecemlineatus]KAG3293382.1 hypothetical protein H1C71_014951 [Ictidomys tridecemlineatus]KAG3293383.1 hypothetical protein H1C71_014951 [Ictidomys tridecemlineatus]KAG3293384.1 hypothetical protein H1C71_014951 [Ictidomys tridecemlineatus]